MPAHNSQKENLRKVMKIQLQYINIIQQIQYEQMLL